MKKNIFYIMTVFLLIACAGSSQSEWEELFNGNDLTGWVGRNNGKGIFNVENGEIVGITARDSLYKNTFLCTEKEYGDFILEFESKVDTALNSGVQFRSKSEPWYKDGRVYGPQLEIANTGNTGAIYDEARYGVWLYKLDREERPDAASVYKNGEWNYFRIEAIGDNIKTWVNGVPVANLVSDLDASGFIGLQVHGVDVQNKPWTEGITARWRNIRILTENLEANRKTDTEPVKQVDITDKYRRAY